MIKLQFKLPQTLLSGFYPKDSITCPCFSAKWDQSIDGHLSDMEAYLWLHVYYIKYYIMAKIKKQTRFIRYCSEQDLDPFYACMDTVAELLVFTFNNTTNEYSAIHTARSALSSFLPSITGMTVGKHPF